MQPTLASPSTEAFRVAAFLGIEKIAENRVALADCVARGLPVKTVDTVRAKVGNAVFGKILPAATMNRVKRQAKPLSREASEKLYEFGRTYELALRIYRGDAERMMAFMQRPHALLDGRTPLELATSSSAGADAVIDLLNRADAGFAA